MGATGDHAEHGGRGLVPARLGIDAGEVGTGEAEGEGGLANATRAGRSQPCGSRPERQARSQSRSAAA